MPQKNKRQEAGASEGSRATCKTLMDSDTAQSLPNQGAFLTIFPWFSTHNFSNLSESMLGS